MVETLAAALSGATLGKDASPFSGTAGGPSRTGQCFIAISLKAASGGHFTDRITALTAAIREQDSSRVPSDGRTTVSLAAQKDGVEVNNAVLERIKTIIG